VKKGVIPAKYGNYPDALGIKAKLATALAKLRGPVPGPHARQIRKQHPFRWQVFEQVQRTMPARKTARLRF
jgi:hypothetical protein